MLEDATLFIGGRDRRTRCIPACTSLSMGMLEYATPFNPDEGLIRPALVADDRSTVGTPAHLASHHSLSSSSLRCEGLPVAGPATGSEGDPAPLVRVTGI